MINDDVNLAKKLNSDGCHLGQKDMKIIEARKFIGDKILGITCHNSIKLAKIAMKSKADYLAFGAFYSSKTKKTKYRANLKVLKKIKKITKIPIVAIGGINSDNYKNLLLNKANFLAISGYIWNNKKLKPIEAIKKFKMKINASEIRVGMLLEHKNDLWQVIKTQHVKPGKGGAFAQVEMKSVNKNTKLNERFRSNETVEKASLEEVKFNFLYEDENDYFFMEPKSFEQIQIKKDLVGDKGKLLTENLNVTVSFYNEQPISVDLPNQVKCKIETTDAALKGQTVSSSYKPAILDNGLNIQVPPFIEAGDEIVIDTRNLEYIKKFNYMNSISANLNIMIKASEKASKILIRDFGELEKLQVSKKGAN